jgi:hypothetical protein
VFAVEEDEAAERAEEGKSLWSLLSFGSFGGGSWMLLASGEGEPDDFEVDAEGRERRFERRGSFGDIWLTVQWEQVDDELSLSSTVTESVPVESPIPLSPTTH